MKPINSLLDTVRDAVRYLMRLIASGLNKLSRGHLSPNMVTLTGLVAHIWIAWLIAERDLRLAAVLLVVFGLFDSLDGALARLQDKTSSAGMLLDASTDRMKEVLLYVGVAFAFAAQNQAYFATWAVAACGGSLLVSYIKAKGETAVANELPANEVNRLFQDGLMRYEIRMSVLVLGLLFNQLPVTIVIIALLASMTAVGRLIKIYRKLS